MSSPDYQSLIDAEIWAFIRRSESFYPPETASFSLAQQRAVYDEMCRAFHAGRPEGVTSEDHALGGISCRIYSPASAPAGTLLYFH
ncbi:esterase, partial [Thioclava sp. BHET1]